MSFVDMGDVDTRLDSAAHYNQAAKPLRVSRPDYRHNAPVLTTVVKERGFNPVTFGVHACLWVFLHWWLALLTVGLWLLVTIPVTFIGWRVKKTVPVQQIQGPDPPHAG
ncbi:MAG: hypothetical protein JWQ95_5293 [Sphaerisporangium sp.]|jgi:hypothetical protein|nr:hypothetical protein [Sphaerisporangium sp.]